MILNITMLRNHLVTAPPHFQTNQCLLIIIKGGRFTEAYYWDTYFSIEGLLASQMPETTKNMIKNFVDEIMEFGFIPNGFRKYFRVGLQTDLKYSKIFRHFLKS